MSALYPIFNYRSKLNTKNKLLLFKSCLRPILTYASPAWNSTCKTNYKKLQILQNKALRIALQKRRYTKISDLHAEAKTPYIESYIHKLTTNFFKQAKKSNLSVLRPLCSYIVPPKIKYKRVMHNIIN